VPSRRLRSNPVTRDAKTTAGPDQVGNPTKGACVVDLELFLGETDPCDTFDHFTGQWLKTRVAALVLRLI